MESNKAKNLLCSRSIRAGHRVYHLDAQVDSRGSRFVAISELKASKGDPQRRQRHRVQIYEEDIPRFLDALSDVLTELADERRRQSGEQVVDALHTEDKASDSIARAKPTQIEIPALDDILKDKEDNID